MKDDFYVECFRNQKVYTIKDASGFPAPKNNEGKRAQPFWSSDQKAFNIIRDNNKLKSFDIYVLTLDEFLEKWLVGLEKDQINIGLNWSGNSLRGYDLSPSEVSKNFEKLISRMPK